MDMESSFVSSVLVVSVKFLHKTPPSFGTCKNSLVRSAAINEGWAKTDQDVLQEVANPSLDSEKIELLIHFRA